jgi:hypothetical protein
MFMIIPFIGRPKKMERLVGVFTFETSEASFAADAPNRGPASPVSVSFGGSALLGRVCAKEKFRRFCQMRRRNDA